MFSNPVDVHVVDDDFLIQHFVETFLQDAGFAVVSFSSAEDAINRFSAAPDCGVLITDVNLGGSLTGWDVARCAREANPLLPVIYMTGDSGHEWSTHGVTDSILVTKPFVPAQIVNAVFQLIGKPPT